MVADILVVSGWQVGGRNAVTPDTPGWVCAPARLARAKQDLLPFRHFLPPLLVSSPSSTMSTTQCQAWQEAFYETPTSVLIGSGLAAVFMACLLVDKLAAWHVFHSLRLAYEYLWPVPIIQVDLTPAEAKDDGIDVEPSKTVDLIDRQRPGFIQCYDPSTRQRLGEVPAMTSDTVHALCVKAAAAQKEWAKTSFAQRRRVLRVLQRYITAHVQDICRVAARDSGKPPVDALLGEILTTCEKIRTINAWGELWLRPQRRPVGPMMVHKAAWVEYVPLGVIGTIAPWVSDRLCVSCCSIASSLGIIRTIPFTIS